ncbi:MAG TPA: PDZ domain-containing protein [Sedimentisphaerales bacterium]|nr:PDZ domain-containing protein [Sedimentisphaerales bacterium]
MSKLGISLIVLAGCVQVAAFGATPEEKFDEGYLGVFLKPVPEVLAAHLGLDAGVGVVASDVAAESPAYKAGLKQYDVILSIDGKEIKDQHELAESVRSTGAGSTVTLDIISKGQKKQVQAVLGSLPEVRGQARGQRRLLGEEDVFRDLLERNPVVPRVWPAPEFRPEPGTPLVDPELDLERWTLLEERMAQVEKQQVEILEKLNQLLAR